MHAISQIHFDGERLTRVRLHEVDREAASGFVLDGGRDASVSDVIQLLQAGEHVRLAISGASGSHQKGGFVTRNFEGQLISLPIVGSDSTRLGALPRY